MAIKYPDGRVEAVHRVLREFERNGYDDSDWYVVYWDDKTESIVIEEYDSTRCGSTGIRVTVDADILTQRKAYKLEYRRALDQFNTVYLPKRESEFSKGDTVRVVKGRKVPIGTTGRVFWEGAKKVTNWHSVDYVGIDTGNGNAYISRDNVELATKREFSPEEQFELFRDFVNFEYHCAWVYIRIDY